MAGLVLAFGFFFGCSNSNNFQVAKLNLNQANYSKALTSINKAIEKNPRNAEAYFYKGFILNKMALEKNDPTQSGHLFSEMRDALLQSRNLYDGEAQKNKNYFKINQILTDSWSHEHNQGVRILKNDSTLSKHELNKSLLYLENATIIQPDSGITYKVESEVYYKLGDLNKAVTAMETAVSKDSEHTKNNIERLAFLYLENQQYDHAIDTYKEALENDPGNINLLHGLENAYLANGDHQKAAALIKRLINKDPKNANYRLTYGTQLYSIGQTYLGKLIDIRKRMEQLSDNGSQKDHLYKALTDSANSIENSAQKYFDNAENQLLKSQSIDSTNINTTYALGILYHDYGTAYLTIKDLIQEKKLADLYSAKVQRLFKESLPYLEKVAQNQPQSPGYWQILYKVYNYLGMKQKADTAYTKFQQQS
jgi:tetratricopeptide (TPR) repeat protein